MTTGPGASGPDDAAPGAGDEVAPGAGDEVAPGAGPDDVAPGIGGDGAGREGGAASGEWVELVPWTGPIPPDHPDANFLVDIATWSLADPLATLRRLSANVDVPVGALARYVLARWVTAGSEAILEVGPTTLERMRAAVAAAEEDGTDRARLSAYRALAEQLAWLGHGLDDPTGTYPHGSANPPG